MSNMRQIVLVALVLTTSTVLIVGIVSSGEENIVNAFCKQAKAVPCVSAETYAFDQDVSLVEATAMQSQNDDVSSETKLNSNDIFNAVHVKLDKQTGRVATLTPVRRSKRVQKRNLSLKKQESFDIQVNRNELEEILLQRTHR